MFERRYSLAKFSVNLETKTIEIAETFSEALNSVAGVAIPVDVRERYADAVQGYTRGTISVVSTMSATEALSSAPPWRPLTASRRRCRDRSISRQYSRPTRP